MFRSKTAAAKTLTCGVEHSSQPNFTQPGAAAAEDERQFVVEDGRVYANGTILSALSPVLAEMLTARGQGKVILLPDVTLDDFLQLVKVTHPPYSDIDVNNVLKLLHLAEKYQLANMTMRCESYLKAEKHGASVKNLYLADRYNLPVLRRHCMNHLIHKRQRSLTKDAFYEQLSKDTLLELMTLKVYMFEETCPSEELGEQTSPRKYKKLSKKFQF